MAFGLYSDLREVFAQPRLEDWLEDSSPSEEGRRSHRSRDLRIQQADVACGLGSTYREWSRS